ncbi:hypothetical protein [Fictibacillus phosphorivorans]|uniref:hypothetical protein n=1 Tax=Fictibacillus phosphorivorans TaxID=1221500 RepID=UPI00129395AD|nr:hypothetical protein [Fictibacillus phosphorivorans]MQR93699.1 hypothetical protein [Fictibacillus phosphorivorans]
MSIQALFTPKLSKKVKQKYLYTELKKRKLEFEKEGLSGIEYKNKVLGAKTELEREIKNGIIRKYIKPTTEHKRIFHKHILDHNLHNLFTTAINVPHQLPPAIRSHVDFTSYISKQNLFSTIFPAFERFDQGGRQPCVFTKENVGWTTKDDKGYYHYCSKSERTGVIYGFSLLDIVEIVFEEPLMGTSLAYINARRRIANVLNIQYNELDFQLQQEDKYSNNLTLIKDIDTIKQNFPNLHSLIKSQLYVLKKLHTFAMSNIMEQRHAVNKEAVFFVSTRTLMKDLKENYNIEKSHTTIASAINLFATLRLLHKIPSEKLQSKEFLYNIAIEIRKDNIEYNLINFMTIPFYDFDRLTKAENIAKRLLRNNIKTAKQITRASLLKVFGEKKANKVFGVKIVNIRNMSPEELYELSIRVLQDVPIDAINRMVDEMI